MSSFTVFFSNPPLFFFACHNNKHSWEMLWNTSYRSWQGSWREAFESLPVLSDMDLPGMTESQILLGPRGPWVARRAPTSSQSQTAAGMGKKRGTGTSPLKGISRAQSLTVALQVFSKENYYQQFLLFFKKKTLVFYTFLIKKKNAGVKTQN